MKNCRIFRNLKAKTTYVGIYLKYFCSFSLQLFTIFTICTTKYDVREEISKEYRIGCNNASAEEQRRATVTTPKTIAKIHKPSNEFQLCVEFFEGQVHCLSAVSRLSVHMYVHTYAKTTDPHNPIHS